MTVYIYLLLKVMLVVGFLPLQDCIIYLIFGLPITITIIIEAVMDRI
jgi:hypothetical protein